MPDSTSPVSTTDVAREELMPLLEQLLELVRAENEVDQAAFFGRIREGIAHTDEPDDLMGPFMELSMSAFKGFFYSPVATLLIDRILERAQTLSTTLSASDDAMQ